MHFESTGPRLTDVEVRELETRLGVNLPRDYRRFILETNGAVPVPQVVETPTGDQQWSINVLLGLSRPMESSNVESVLRDIRETVPPGFVPIAVGDTGEIVLLAVEGANAGSVVMWQWQEDDFATQHRHLYPLARSFTEFLGHFRNL